MMAKEQIALWPDHASAESAEYLERQLITYIGNKRALLKPIGQAVEQVKRRLGVRKLRSFDAFSGSGVVSRFLKAHSTYLASNDLEDYVAVTNRCYLRNRSTVDWKTLQQWVAELNARVCDSGLDRGFIEELYAPRNDEAITVNDRVFYTRQNAQRLDNYRRLIERAPGELKDLLLAPLISRASIHANTAGVFKGFYKNKHTRVGQFGGSGADALVRIKGQIEVELPILSRFECDYDVLQSDANDIARQLSGLDLTYLDPPYNQHPYGSNYFMLNLLARYERPVEVSQVSGIPTNWRRSGYNVKARSLPLLRELLESLDSKFFIVSFSNEGFITPPQMREMLERLGTVSVFETAYNTFRGSRNLNNRSIHVTEQLFLLERR